MLLKVFLRNKLKLMKIIIFRILKININKSFKMIKKMIKILILINVNETFEFFFFKPFHYLSHHFKFFIYFHSSK